MGLISKIAGMLGGKKGIDRERHNREKDLDKERRRDKNGNRR
ncbi:MAG TPA: hypothetical protein VGL47_18950 [Amycolatopsis sp.]|uniref:CsbD family protein n=1 Tax=Amycolatopsis nalaikhensis TaxID=715472 RepID=A0ABY8XR45_9PSEU|nr:hypothetical protein [Amycolatopsis sp. 2-2]WIV58066.1 hypothetical protein QP939_05180 [Amycolatopsis sp. 2-2]